MVGLLVTLIGINIICNGSEVPLFKELEVIFIRHGQTDWSYDQILQGPADPCLNETGKKEIFKSASYLKSLNQSWNMWSSPYKRTSDTAKILLDQAVSIRSHSIKEILKERYYGDFRLDDKNPPDKETDQAFNNRIKNLADLIKQESEPLLIVAHAKVFEELSLILTRNKQKIGFGEVFCFKRDKFGYWEIKCLYTL